MESARRTAWKGRPEGVKATYSKAEEAKPGDRKVFRGSDPHHATGSEENGMGRPAIEGESPVSEAEGNSGYPEYRGTRGIL